MSSGSSVSHACCSMWAAVARRTGSWFSMGSMKSANGSASSRSSAELDDVLREDGLKEELRAKQRGNQKYISTAAKLLAPVCEGGDIVAGFDTVGEMLRSGKQQALATELEISLHEALTGFRRPLTHLDGRRVWLEDSEVSRPGQRKRLRGFGMPRFRGRGKGDLLVQLSVAFPTAPLTGESARLLRQLLPRNVAAGSPRQGEHLHRLQALTAEEEEEAEEEAAGGRGGGGRGGGGFQGGFSGFRM